MKKHKIWVSRHHLTRCSSCSRHHQLEHDVNPSELMKLSCDFCGGPLIAISHSSSHELTRASRLGGRSSKIAMGLLSASLSFSACDPDEEIETNDAGTPMAGEVAGELAGDVIAQPAYGVMPFAGDSVVDPIAGSEAGVAVPPYGSFGAEEAGEASPIAGDVVEMDMGIAGDDSPQPEYGAFPAGEEIEVDMSVSGDDSPQPDYGAFPAGEG